jgi:protein SCO1/2
VRGTAAFILVISIASIAAAQPIPPQQLMDQIGVDQKLDQQVPLDLTFRDESGKSVRLGEYFGEKPVVLSLVYYECPMLCGMTLNGMLKTFKVLPFTIGQEYEVVTVSFDSRETPELAARKKGTYVKQYGRDNAGKGWHFLTGDDESIRRLCDAVGFRFIYDEPTKQFAHASAIMVLTPNGKLSRYFYGLEYVPKDLRLGLIEAADEKIGSPVDHVLLLCYQYDPKTGKYGFAVMTAVRVGAVLTIATIGAFMLVMIRRDRRMKASAVDTTGETQA